MESKIVSAEEIAKQFFYAHDINVIRCIKESQRQAKEATLEFAGVYVATFIDPNEKESILNLSNAPELDVS